MPYESIVYYKIHSRCITAGFWAPTFLEPVVFFVSAVDVWLLYISLHCPRYSDTATIKERFCPGKGVRSSSRIHRESRWRLPRERYLAPKWIFIQPDGRSFQENGQRRNRNRLNITKIFPQPGVISYAANHNTIHRENAKKKQRNSSILAIPIDVHDRRGKHIAATTVEFHR